MDPLTALTRKTRKAHCINPKFEWPEDDYLPSACQINNGAGYTAGDTTFTIDGGALFRAGSILKCIRTGEQFRIVGTPNAPSTTSTGTLVRGTNAGVTAAAALVDNDTLIWIGMSSNEFSTAPTVLTTTKTFNYNYIQFHRWPWAAADAVEASELYGGSDMNYQGKKAGMEHKIQIEKTSLFGERHEDATGASVIRQSDGVLRLITTNVTDVGGVLTLNTLETFLKNGLRYGSSEKFFFVSRTVASLMNQLAASYIRSFPTTEKFPLRIKMWTSGHGDIPIVVHNLLTTPFSNAPTDNDRAYDGWGFLIDMNSIYYRFLRGLDTHIKTNIQANDASGRSDEYRTYCGIQLVTEKKHAILKDVETI
jgi:hypothetical protein